uniref:DinB-like domain-containing protein n=1 Tax=Thermosporothrix sp. COM3 TaxID=2490863 RepID=A0A455SG40_9CHLR|nr:hypothetical protein KTC_21680 [Thermosporothrix sp. COM3]
MNASVELHTELFNTLHNLQEQVRAQAAHLDQAQLFELATTRALLTLLLRPHPAGPIAHLEAAHAAARSQLEHLPAYDPTRLIAVDEGHSYTPRKVLRRILDHALDHLNQIDQWLLWQQQGIVPVPTDGWTTSGETLPEDLHPVNQAEIQSWLWRIDLAVQLVAQRARQLSSEQLDWTPPDGGWTLRYMLHHLAEAETYYCYWISEPLPEEALARYNAASQRLEQRFRHLLSTPLPPEQTFSYARIRETVDALITTEQALL